MADNSAKLVHAPERTAAAWFRDVDGVHTTQKSPDTVLKYQFDYTAPLRGETISTSTWTNEGVTASGGSTSGGVATITIAGTDGSAKHTITTSGGRTLVYRYAFVSPASNRQADYQ